MTTSARPIGTGFSRVTHVGLVISHGTMINAPDFDEPVRVDPIAKGIVGAARPAS
ncbi:hypothetical protein [Amycolatopsis sp. MEPSY49]|uniref:hypothetical protein n=1 Tax=Amycolatopsis sp. MEPSY49 TaxID=3151600 RepID=UPI003EF4311C